MKPSQPFIQLLSKALIFLSGLYKSVYETRRKKVNNFLQTAAKFVINVAFQDAWMNTCVVGLLSGV